MVRPCPLALLAFVFAGTSALAVEEVPPIPETPAQVAAPPLDTGLSLHGPIGLSVMPLAYVETFYQWNFNNPSNGITAYRGFDDRHNTFTLSNVALGTAWRAGPVYGRVVFQIGNTPNAYYLDEPTTVGYAPGGVGTSDASLWRFIQEAYVGYKAPVRNGVSFQMGLFLSPIGPESLAIKDSWNWSRSDLFFGLPAYHAGVRVRYNWGNGWATVLSAYNGWNSVVDDNAGKSIEFDTRYKKGKLNLDLLYFGGVERPTGDPAGQPWRSDFEANVEIDATEELSFLSEANGGFESNRFGISDWTAGALYARVRAQSWLYFAARGDFFFEGVPSNALGSPSHIFWPVPWVSSATFTVDFRPTDHISLRVEGRHDLADGAMFFAGRVAGTGSPGRPFLPSADKQTTLTWGATAWF
jgi:hypothetical protein